MNYRFPFGPALELLVVNFLSLSTQQLQALVSDHLNEDTGHSDLKQQYVRILNERRGLLDDQDSLNGELRLAEDERKEAREIIESCMERQRSLERDLKQANTDKIILEKKLKVCCCTVLCLDVLKAGIYGNCV